MSFGQMSNNKKVMASLWCRGPAVPWTQLTGTERLAVAFRKEADDSRTALLEDLASNFGECGIQYVELDMSNPDDIYPMNCPICKTDMNWDIQGFFKTYPQYKSEFDE